MKEKYVAVKTNDYLDKETINIINEMLRTVSEDLGLRENQIRFAQDITHDPLKLEQHKFIMLSYLTK